MITGVNYYNVMQDSPFFKYIHNNPSDNRLFIVFGVKGTKPGAFAFYRTFCSLNINVLFIAPDQDNWYHNGLPDIGNNLTSLCEGLDNIINELCDRYDFKSIKLFGSSMGGYLSLVYLELSNVKVPLSALVLGTETKLNLPSSYSEKSGYEYDETFIDLKTRTFRNRDVDMVYGEFDIVDSYCALRMKELKNFKIKSHRFSGHIVPKTLEETIGMKTFINDYNDGVNCFIGMGHMTDFLDAKDLEPLIFESKNSSAYIDALLLCLKKYPAFGWGWNRYGVYLHNKGLLSESKFALERSLLVNPFSKNSAEHLSSVVEKLAS
ncbi:hypothetical protein [Atlantibacter hermannii]|uniref:hypothetical protein n=1 Tax=Atlantibacter hermannii TaxID=565 RepID=UPI0013EF3176|nr:hypothetical protein [Atlantibacter hermannii]